MSSNSLYFLLVLLVAFIVSKAEDLDLDDEEIPVKIFQKWPIKAVRPAVQNVTSTMFVTTTTVTTSFATLHCAVTASVTGPCRRKRGIQEQPIQDGEVEIELIAKKLQPTEVQRVELTAMPLSDVGAAFELSSSQVINADEDTTTMPEEINSDILQRRNPILFNRFKVKSTVILTKVETMTSTVTVTSATKTFTISGCIPADFSDFSCPSLTIR